jgi:hypothetical protein
VPVAKRAELAEIEAAFARLFLRRGFGIRAATARIEASGPCLLVDAAAGALVPVSFRGLPVRRAAEAK